MAIDLHGTGALPSPPDPRDYQITDLLAAAPPLAGAPPSIWFAPHWPPVQDQGLDPTCVSFSHGSLKAWHDKIDQGFFPDFNEPLMHQLIGGTNQGAVARYCLERMKDYGYPVVGLGQPELHKINAYYAVPLNIGIIKSALMTFGPLTLLGPWYPSWTNIAPNAILGAPFGIPNGHCVLVVGWDDSRGLLCQNSWGTNWGDNGRFWMPYSFVEIISWEAWKVIDQEVYYLPDTGTDVPDTGGPDEMAWIHMVQFTPPKKLNIIASPGNETPVYKGPGREYPVHTTLKGTIQRTSVGRVDLPDNKGTWWLFKEGDGIGGFFAPKSKVRTP